MVSFGKPNLLGNTKEFRSRFVNPISNGQHKDSTDSEVIDIKKQAHVLNNTLDGVLDRKDFSHITDFLPTKHEYVLSIRLSEKQIALYRAYLNDKGLKSLDANFEIHNGQLFSDFQELSRVWTHPMVLKLNQMRPIVIKKNKKKGILWQRARARRRRVRLIMIKMITIFLKMNLQVKNGKWIILFYYLFSFI
jgi:transcriptional regulator ATRX